MSATSHINIYQGTLLDEIIGEQKLSRELVKTAAREIFTIIKEGLLRDGVVRINHFGSFKLKRVATRKGRNPKTGEPITIQGHAKVMFTPCKALREMIDPFHAKPIPLTTAAVSASIPSKKRVEISGVAPESAPTPTLLKIAQESRSAIEQIGQYDEDDPATENGQKGSSKKWAYFGIAATIIALVVINSIDSKVDTPQQTTIAPPIIKPIMVAELEIKVPEVAAPSPPVAVRLIDNAPKVVVVAAQKPKLPQAAISSPAAPEAVIEPSTFAVVAPRDSPVETDFKEPVEIITATAQAKPSTEPFFTQRSHKLITGNSLWRLSKRFYTKPLYWPYIFYSNAAAIADPDRLQTGRAIVIPALEGSPGNLTINDRENIAEGYFLTYNFYKNSGHPDAFFALLEAKRYSAAVVERKRHTLTLSRVENIMLDSFNGSFNGVRLD